MAKINHCHQNHCATAYWLTSKDPRYDYEVLLEADCSFCQKTVLERYGYHHDQGEGPRSRIPKKQHDFWLLRKTVDLQYMRQGRGDRLKDTRKKVFVGEYTLRVSQKADYHVKL